MTGHTPGPWSRSWVYGGIRHLNKNVDYDAFWFPDDGEDQEAANIPNVRNHEADADLIAAAPDLLAALRTVRDALAPLKRPDLWRLVDAAIAKAEGK